MKIQTEDDITASVVVPAGALKHAPGAETLASLKLVKNCEQRLFQRPDEAVHRGYDRQTEEDFARPDNFFSNYEPLTPAHARELAEDSIGFYQFTEPMQALLPHSREHEDRYFVSSAHPRLVDGKPKRTRVTCKSGPTDPPT